jgi:hypothetical protein
VGDDTGHEDDAPFLSRWSRRKLEAKETPPAQPATVAAPAAEAAEPAPMPELPPLASLDGLKSEYKDFLLPQVDEQLRRGALKKLFSDPHFNVMDRLDTYIDDYSQPDPLPAGMLAGLRQAQNILAWAQETKEQTAARYAPPAIDGGDAPSSAQVLPVQESTPSPAMVQSPDVAPLAAAPPEEDGKA